MPDDKSRYFLLWTGAITAFTVTLLLVPVGLAFLVPAIQQVREARQREQVREDLRTIGMVLANYHDHFAHPEAEFPLPDAPADALRYANRP